MAQSGLLFEFGPVPQGVLKSKQFLLMESVVKEALNFLALLDEDDKERVDFEKGHYNYETYHVTKYSATAIAIIMDSKYFDFNFIVH